jgi:dihydroorotate dehydrogenase electron transfer subunit
VTVASGADRRKPLRVDADVVANAVEGGESRRLRLAVPDWPGFEPGQFVMLSPGARGSSERDDPLLPRPMAVYRAGPGGGVEILYKIHGRGTALLADARPGDRVRMVGPLGRGFPLPSAGSRALLVGGGTGIASLYELAARAAERADVCVLLGARAVDDLMGREDFAGLGVTLRVATEDGSEGTHGLVTELLAEELAAGPASVYACGPTPMMRAAAQLAGDASATAYVSLENPMACGFGVCLGCAAPLAAGGFALVCRDGPVFEAGAVDWENAS